jgi:hypothetical protein
LCCVPVSVVQLSPAELLPHLFQCMSLYQHHLPPPLLQFPLC